MANNKRSQRSQEDIVTQAAQLVAGTINPEAMGLSPEEVDVEHFIQHFKEVSIELLTKKDHLLLAIGPFVNTDKQHSEIYSSDIRFILDKVENQLQTTFCFHYGILLWLSNAELYANWLPH